MTSRRTKEVVHTSNLDQFIDGLIQKTELTPFPRITVVPDGPISFHREILRVRFCDANIGADETVTQKAVDLALLMYHDKVIVDLFESSTLFLQCAPGKRSSCWRCGDSTNRWCLDYVWLSFLEKYVILMCYFYVESGCLIEACDFDIAAYIEPKQQQADRTKKEAEKLWNQSGNLFNAVEIQLTRHLIDERFGQKSEYRHITTLLVACRNYLFAKQHRIMLECVNTGTPDYLHDLMTAVVMTREVMSDPNYASGVSKLVGAIDPDHLQQKTFGEVVRLASFEFGKAQDVLSCAEIKLASNKMNLIRQACVNTKTDHRKMLQTRIAIEWITQHARYIAVLGWNKYSDLYHEQLSQFATTTMKEHTALRRVFDLCMEALRDEQPVESKASSGSKPKFKPDAATRAMMDSWANAWEDAVAADLELSRQDQKSKQPVDEKWQSIQNMAADLKLAQAADLLPIDTDLNPDGSPVVAECVTPMNFSENTAKSTTGSAATDQG